MREKKNHNGNDMDTMHLFAGVGGGLLADLILGHRPVVAVEWEPYACQVLRERAAEGWFPDLRVWEGDVRMFDPSEYAGKVDCIHAGFPCQDISVAGKQAGVGPETRSGLYREVLRIAGVVRPSYLFLENVAAIVTNGLDTVLGDITSLGYDVEWLCIRASDCGANHHRDRWWCLCTNTNGNGCKERINVIRPGGTKEGSKRAWRKAYGAFAARNDSDSKCRESQMGREVGRTRREQQQIQRNGYWKTSAEPCLDRNHHGIPTRLHRLKGLGNAQVPLQAAVAWKLLGGK